MSDYERRDSRDDYDRDYPAYEGRDGYGDDRRDDYRDYDRDDYRDYDDGAPKQDTANMVLFASLGLIALTIIAALLMTFTGFLGGGDDSDPMNPTRNSDGNLASPTNSKNIPVPSSPEGSVYRTIDGVDYYLLPSAPAPYGDLTRVDWGHPRLEVVSTRGSERLFAADLEKCDDTVTPTYLKCVYKEGHGKIAYWVGA